MCGIAALISEDNRNVEGWCLYEMLRLLRHRGDQPPRTEHFGRAALGCVRLAIIGRSEGSQPFSDPDGHLSVVFNGEIYNHRELRSELESVGAEFRSECDTEVILHGYRRWGSRLVSKLKGMYAFIVFDQKSGGFFAARDPFGIKPIYYARAGHQWAFSSEIYPLVKIGFNQVNAIRPGTYIHNGKESERSLAPNLSIVPIDLEAAKSTLRKLIKQSVGRLLDTDLKVGVFCSGGIDSSIILYEAAQIARDRIVAYCVGTEDSSDLAFARRVAGTFGVSFKPVLIDKKRMVDSIAKTITIIESFEPNHIRTGTTNVALARRVHEDGIKVVLCGEGADELFGGYEEFPHAVKSGHPEDLEGLFCRFIDELHKTQLQRVDRTTMAYGIEARVPYLETDLSQFVLSIPTEFKVRRLENGKVVPKYVLRESYRNTISDDVVDRRKVPMGEGAGVGDNGLHGPFYEYANAVLKDNEFESLIKKYPDIGIRNKEEAYYFMLYQRRFGTLDLARHRPMTNVMATT
jgi:asparagine synthase (glutamine-hydrolysing)